MTLYLLATLDTKGGEADYVRGLLRGWGHDVALVDCGSFGDGLFVIKLPNSSILALRLIDNDSDNHFTRMD